MTEQRKLAAILAADVAGFSRLAGADEERTLARLRALRSDLIDPTVSLYKGRVVNRAGDGTVVEFRSVVEAVRCAIEVQKAMLERNAGLPQDRRIELRIGIHLGDVVEESDGNLMGDGVNIAARIEAISEPGAIVLSEDAYRQVRARIDIEIRDLGETKLKNIAEPIRVYGLRVGDEAAESARARASADADDDSSRRGPHPSVAVMPFDNLGEASDEYFADGVVEEITSALSRIRDFIVVARQSAFTFKGRFVDVREIGRALGVAYVVEGTVRRGGDRLRISVQLIDVATRAQLWSDRYEGSTGEIFDFQDRISAHVAGALKPAIRLAEIEAARRKPPASLKAYDFVMRAFPKLWGQNAAAIAEAIPILEEAIRIDPRYGRAHALLAWCHGLNATYLWTQDPNRDIAAARLAIGKTVGLIDDDPTGLTAAGAATGFCGDQEGASALIERALGLDANNAWAWSRWGWIGVYLGAPELALQRFEKAMQLSPLDPFAFNTRMGIASALARSEKLDEAIAIAKDVSKRHPEVTWVHRQLACWAAMAGDLETARGAARRLLAAQPDFTIRRYLAIPALRDMPEHRDRMAEGLRDAGLPEG